MPYIKRTLTLAFAGLILTLTLAAQTAPRPSPEASVAAAEQKLRDGTLTHPPEVIVPTMPQHVEFIYVEPWLGLMPARKLVNHGSWTENRIGFVARITWKAVAFYPRYFHGKLTGHEFGVVIERKTPQ